MIEVALAWLCFVGLLALALVAIPALAVFAQSEPLVAWDNVLWPPPRQWRRPREREPRCFCSDRDYQSAYHAKWREAPPP